MAVFPDAIAYMKLDGHSEKFPKRINYVNNHRIENAEIKGTIVIKCANNTADFFDWYKNDIAYGYDAFDITMPLFGIESTWSIKFISDLTSALSSRNYSGTIPFTAQVQNVL